MEVSRFRRSVEKCSIRLQSKHRVPNTVFFIYDPAGIALLVKRGRQSERQSYKVACIRLCFVTIKQMYEHPTV